MAYDAATRVWYGPESYQNALRYNPTGHDPATDPALPCIVYRPGGGWAGADVADLASRVWWTYGLNDATSPHDSTYVVFVLQTASIGYNRAKVTGNTAWADATAYGLSDYRGRAGRLWRPKITHTSSYVSAPSATWASGATYVADDTVLRRTVTRRQYRCILGHVASASNEAGLGVDTATYWTDESETAAWADGNYAVGDLAENGGDVYFCVATVTAGTPLVDEPGAGSAWEASWRLLATEDEHNCTAYWSEVGRNETGQRQVADIGELTPGGLDEMVNNCQQFIGWLRRNAATYGINPAQICLAGASAGGQMAGCAAYAEDLPWARDSQVYGACRQNRYHKTQPNATLLSITPVDLAGSRHTTYGLLNGLYGEDKTDPQWVATPDAEKRAMSPLHVLKRTGLAVPTCLDFVGAGSHTPGTAFTGLTGSPYHHPDNGWLMLQYLTAAPTTGLGQSGHTFFDDTDASEFPAWSGASVGYVVADVVAAGGVLYYCTVAHTSGASTEPGVGASWETVWQIHRVYRSYTTFGGSATAAGTSVDPRTAASAIITWLNGAM